MQKTKTYKQQITDTITILSVLLVLIGFIPGFMAISHADSIKINDAGKPVSKKDIDRWERMSRAEKERLRKLNKKYQSMPVEQQAQLKKRMKAFNKLPRKIQHVIINNYHMLGALSKDDRKSFFNLIRKYQHLAPNKKKTFHRAFRKVKTMSKKKQQAFFKILIQENRKQHPAVRKAIEEFLIKEGLKD